MQAASSLVQLDQTVTGLTPGDVYTFKFDYCKKSYVGEAYVFADVNSFNYFSVTSSSMLSSWATYTRSLTVPSSGQFDISIQANSDEGTFVDFEFANIYIGKCP
ncbi:hypothetical protein SBRCBS47491_010013 [Sporothrix bragantina]|uniref:CBM-cenC domain-containing protein n=1 Tax=Sporothrix bragantina TaxID=671064 RepID=A0ABP0D356_9PEZI